MVHTVIGYKAAAQVLKKADPLKIKVCRKEQDLLNDLQAWTDQQQLQTIYHQVLVLDLEYALDKKVEQDLWMLCFKHQIVALQEQTRDKKNPRRSEAQGLLSWCLEAASGFYLSLLQELCTTYDLDLPFRGCGTVFGKLRSYTERTTVTPQSSSCLYICQYCLVHLGDIARYRNQRQQAESFYKHAILVSPHSGHPYNQLALLEASQGDRLATVFQYIRSIAVKNPFPAAIANLSTTLSTQIDKDEHVQTVQTKLSVNEYISMFLRVHALLHTQSDLHEARVCVQSLNATLTALVATQSFSKEQLIMMTVINMYALHHLGTSELTADEKTTWELIVALLAGSLSAFLLPVYTLKNDGSILDYYALPAIRLLLIWIKVKPQLLQENEFAQRLQIWPGYCKLLNTIGEQVDNKYNSDEYLHKPLSYDKDLQGFIPLKEALGSLKFKESLDDISGEKHLQAIRLLNLGRWLCDYDLNGSKLITKQDDGLFEAGYVQPDPTDKLLEEMKSFTVVDSNIDVIVNKLKEKKAGILKPQGSLEKSREERQVKIQEDNHVNDTGVLKIDSAKMRRITQNVALQSIYKKLEENKQVKFSPEATEKPPQPPKPNKPLLSTPPGPPLNLNMNPTTGQQFRAQYSHQYPNMNVNNFGTDMNKEFFSYAPPPQIPMPPQSSAKPMDLDHGMHYPKVDMQNFSLMSGMNNLPPPPPKNMFNAPPPSHSQPPYGYNHNRVEERNNWWPSSASSSSGSNFMPPAPQQQQQQQFNKPTDYYMFQNYQHPGPGSVPNLPQGVNHWGGGGGGVRTSNSAMNMRQAMLNESGKMQHHQTTTNAPSAATGGGYSLFNTSSTWSPALLRNASASSTPSTNFNPQPSLFAGNAPPPQSLQQLLEQQSKLQPKGDNT